MKNVKDIISIILKIITFLILIILIIVEFFVYKSSFTFDYGFIIIICLLVSIALSESFDEIKFSNIFTLKRRIKEIEKDNEELRSINNNLLNSISNTNIINNNYDSKSSNTINEKALEDKIKKEEEFDSVVEGNLNKKEKMSIAETRKMSDYIAIKKSVSNLDQSDIRYNIAIRKNDSNGFINRVLFDAAVHENGFSHFYEIFGHPTILYTRIDRIIDFLNDYSRDTSIKYKLHVIIPVLDKGIDNSSRINFPKNSVEIIRDRYKELINNNVLSVEEVPISEKEFKDHMKLKQQKK